MNTINIHAPLKLHADITLPASKSISNRALIISALANSNLKPEALPHNLSDCDDTDVIVRALRDMPETIDIKAAGTAMRFMTAYLSVTPGVHTITGTERMRHRPIGILVDALRKLGAQIDYVGEEGFPPLRITGPETPHLTLNTSHLTLNTLRGGRLEISGGVSSQYISALLMIAPMLSEGLELCLTGTIVSRPYIDLTLATMQDFGASVEWTGVDTIKVHPVPYTPTPFHIENDWSAASYWYEIASLYSSEDSYVHLHGLFDASHQGDSAVKYMFSLLGIKTTFENISSPLSGVSAPRETRGLEGSEKTIDMSEGQRGALTISGRRLPRLDYDFTNQPDLAQTMVCTCLASGIPFSFRGLASLKIKETDRIEALKCEMRKLGYVIYDYNDCELRWDGERCEPQENAIIETYDDHRMAMAIAPMSIILGDLRIHNPEVVSKSYPHYWDDLKKAGFKIT